MSSSTINRVELTATQRRELQALLERNCSSIFDELAALVDESAREYAESLNPEADETSLETITDQLLNLVDIRCVVTGLND
jgi:Tfp pilus assembly protein PilN